MQKIRVTSSEFRGLKNPYTGEDMVVYMLVGSGPIRFFCPDTYTTADKFADAREAYRAWSRSNGVADVRVGLPILCAYTGEPLHSASDDYGHYYTGGFDPRIPRPRQEFLRLAWMRAGETPYEEAEPAKVEPVLEATGSEFRHTKSLEISDVNLKQAEEIMERSGADIQKKTIVNGRGKKGSK